MSRVESAVVKRVQHREQGCDADSCAHQHDGLVPSSRVNCPRGAATLMWSPTSTAVAKISAGRPVRFDLDADPVPRAAWRIRRGSSCVRAGGAPSAGSSLRVTNWPGSAVGSGVPSSASSSSETHGGGLQNVLRPPVGCGTPATPAAGRPVRQARVATVGGSLAPLLEQRPKRRLASRG